LFPAIDTVELRLDVGTATAPYSPALDAVLEAAVKRANLEFDGTAIMYVSRFDRKNRANTISATGPQAQAAVLAVYYSARAAFEGGDS
jgi:hypothetical protein